MCTKITKQEIANDQLHILVFLINRMKMWVFSNIIVILYECKQL